MRIRVYSRWLLLASLFQLLLYIVGLSGLCLSDQRSSLLQLRNSLVFDLSSSTKLANWNPNVDCCNWTGVVCRSGRVISLELDNESISDGLEDSSDLFALQYLETLNLAFNRFNYSQIPKGLRNLTNLAYLNLSNAAFGGQIPVEISELKSLVSLDLSTQFQPGLPLKLENPNLRMLVQNLSGLRELYLDGVNISSPESDWGRALSSSLPNLRNLSLRGCGLSGPLHLSLLQLHSLALLQLDRNNLSTKVPDYFANFSSLTKLTLSSCSLRGSFPDAIFQVPTLNHLDLSDNEILTGTLRQLPQNGSLRTMVISNTNFSGLLPGSISNLKFLSNVDLSNCSFSGPIPFAMTNLKELFYLDFSFNSFTGSIPHFHMSKKLTYIDLSRNNLSGSISFKHFEGLSNLEYVSLAFNSLNGSIPPSLFGVPSLMKLLLSNNKFGGQLIEFSTPNFSYLDTLDLSSNRLEGCVPKSLFKLEQLSVVLLSSNFFNGTLQLETFRRFRNLTRLELGDNNLSVVASSSNSNLSLFPRLSRLNLASCNLRNFPDLRNQVKLTFVDLSDNHIDREIPSWIWKIGNGALVHLNLSFNFLDSSQKPFRISSSLSVLDLHSNQLSGPLPMLAASAVYMDYSSNNFQGSIPYDMGTFSSTSFFSAANNSLTGAIPKSLCNATNLQVLDLSGNKLSGVLPSCLLQLMKNLGVLNLGRNNISGDIPNGFPVICGLKTLDFSRNKIGGRIPASLANCRSLEVMNIGNNRIDDVFPCMLKNLDSLRVLVLRNNNFHGDLRCQGAKASWPNLQIIDIASNNFSGYLYPKCFSRWKGMTLDNGAQLGGRNHLGFNFLYLNNFYYQDTVTVTVKGLELELVKILTVFTSIDLSSNNFQGEIPDTIGDLSSLYVLNLSHNSLAGPIPKSIGNLKELGSLDLSENQLRGEIPEELTSLTFLSFLNLSYNKLVGMIPDGPQFQTFSSPSYMGNTGLCGFPLNTSCNSNQPAVPELDNIFHWISIFTGLGYGVGAALVIAPLALCTRRREQCNKHLDRFLKLIFPRNGFSYVRYNGKVEAVGDIKDETTDDDEEEAEHQSYCGRYCVFCTKLDIQTKKAIHNPKCRCHHSPPAFSSSPALSSSLLRMHNQNH